MINHYPMYMQGKPDGEPMARMHYDLVVNAQGLYVCPSCRTETHGQDDWTCLCRGCGIRFFRVYDEVLFWPSLIPEQEWSPEPKSEVEKIIDDIFTIKDIMERQKSGGYHFDESKQRAFRSFEKRLRKIIREEINCGPTSVSEPAKLGRRILDLPRQP